MGKLREKVEWKSDVKREKRVKVTEKMEKECEDRVKKSRQWNEGVDMKNNFKK